MPQNDFSKEDWIQVVRYALDNGEVEVVDNLSNALMDFKDATDSYEAMVLLKGIQKAYEKHRAGKDGIA